MEFETMYPFKSNSSWLAQESYNTEWTKEENKMFECAIAIYHEDTPDRWLNVSKMIPGKSVFDVVKQYKVLEQDVSDIEAGRFCAPDYPPLHADNQVSDKHRKKPAIAIKSPDKERKKGVPWTEDEHKRFLMGLIKHGKGDWRSISREFVVTRNPNQVASHAQKYFLRQQNDPEGKTKKRRSIHDITVSNLIEIAASNANQPLSFNEHHNIPAPQQQDLTSMPQVQQLERINQHNDGAPMGFNPNGGNVSGLINQHNDGAPMSFNPNPNGGNTFQPSSSGVPPNTPNLQGEDLCDYGFHTTFGDFNFW